MLAVIAEFAGILRQTDLETLTDVVRGATMAANCFHFFMGLGVCSCGEYVCHR
jgi:hypothetical protein